MPRGSRKKREHNPSVDDKIVQQKQTKTKEGQSIDVASSSNGKSDDLSKLVVSYIQEMKRNSDEDKKVSQQKTDEENPNKGNDDALKVAIKNFFDECHKQPKIDDDLEQQINKIVEEKTAAIKSKYEEEIAVLKRSSRYICPYYGQCQCCHYWTNGEYPFYRRGGGFGGRGGRGRLGGGRECFGGGGFGGGSFDGGSFRGGRG